MTGSFDERVETGPPPSGYLPLPDAALPDAPLATAVLLEALEQAPDAIIICDRAGSMEYVNRSVVAMLGYSRADLLGKTIEVLVPDRFRSQHRSHRFAYVDSPSTRPMGLGMQLSARHCDGREIPVEISLSPVWGETAGRVIAVMRDVAERRQLLDQIVEAHERLAIAEDRDRIARDLHDTVIQRLFAPGLSLQAAIGRPDTGDRIDQAVASIDDAIRDLRTSIFSLRRPLDPRTVGDSVRATIDEARRMLDCPLDVRIGGEVEYRIPSRLRADLVAVIRESLTNIVKHASARRVGVDVDIEGEKLVVRVSDDGTGFEHDGSQSGQGLRNLRDRAMSLGGQCDISSSPGEGTHIVFAIPLS